MVQKQKKNLNMILKVNTILEVSVAFMLISFQCYYILPKVFILIGKIIMPVTVLILALKKNNYKIINTKFIIWSLLFGMICLMSIFYSIDVHKTLDTTVSYFTSLFMIVSISQYINQKNKIQNVLNYLIIGGVLYGILITLLQGPVSIFSGNIDIKYTNGTITQFTYVMVPTALYLIWNVFNNKKYKLLNILALIFIFALNMASGRRKSIIYPVTFLGLMILKKEKNHIKKVVSLVIFIFICAYLYIFVMNNDTLYQLFGYRLDNLVTLFSDEGNGRVDGSLVARQMLISIGIDTFFNNPIFGVGIGTFSNLNDWGYYAHNNYIELLATSGLIGFIGYYSIYMYTSIKLFISRKYKKDTFLLLVTSLLILMLVQDFTMVTYYRPYFMIPICIITSYVYLNNNE